MTPEQRFERIETDLASVAAELAGVMGILRGVAEAQQRQTAALGGLTQAMARYVDSSNDRMTRLEANLDGLIRAITAEHNNGKQER